jgi:hypothetical protein
MAIDANMELVEEDGLIDIFGYMKKLRQARRGLVETLVQIETKLVIPNQTFFH